MTRKRVLALRPTQFAVGMLEVDEKIEVVRKFGRKQRKAYVRDNPVPVIIAPDGAPYVTDHHHFLAVCYHVGIKKVAIKVVKNWSRRKMSYSAFWKWMWKSRHSYPFCQFGEGPRKALYLPRDIRGVADDPYRSLAWFVRKAGAFANSERNFAEFKWANFFRAKRLLDRHGMAGMPAALVKASRLAQSHEARRLPGFEKLKRAALADVRKEIKARKEELGAPGK
jgi:hypothetical protein